MIQSTSKVFFRILCSPKLCIVFLGWTLFCFVLFLQPLPHFVMIHKILHTVRKNFEYGALRLDQYNEIREMYGLIDPYELPTDIQLLHDIEDLSNCTCPRVFYPACGEDTETYFNACILKCINITKMKRLGPCIAYRRMDEIVLILKIPTVWRHPDRAFIKPTIKLDDVVLDYEPRYSETDE